MRLAKATSIHFLSQVVYSVAGFVATFAIARLLGTEGVGVYALGTAVVVWLMIPTNGVELSLNKRVSEGSYLDEYFTAVFILNSGYGLVAAALILFLGGYVDSYVGAEVSILIAAVLLSEIGFRTVSGALHGEKKVAEQGLLEAAEYSLRAVFQVSFMLAGYGVASLFFSHAVSFAVSVLVGIALLNSDIALPSREHFTSLFDFAKYAWVSSLQGITFSRMDVIVLGFFVTPALVGIYQVAWNLASVLVVLSISIRMTLFPEFSELEIQEDYARIHEYLRDSFVFTGLLAIPGLFGAVVIGEELLRIYRPEFGQGYLILLVLILARLIRAYGAQMVYLLNGINRPDLAFRINAAFIALNMVFNVGLVMWLGWLGAAIATLISAFVSLFYGYYYVSRTIGAPDVPYRGISKEIVAASVMAAVVYAAKGALPHGHLTTISLVTMGGLIYFGVLLSISERIRSDLVNLMQSQLR